MRFSEHPTGQGRAGQGRPGKGTEGKGGAGWSGEVQDWPVAGTIFLAGSFLVFRHVRPAMLWHGIRRAGGRCQCTPGISPQRNYLVFIHACHALALALALSSTNVSTRFDNSAGAVASRHAMPSRDAVAAAGNLNARGGREKRMPKAYAATTANFGSEKVKSLNGLSVCGIA